MLPPTSTVVCLALDTMIAGLNTENDTDFFGNEGSTEDREDEPTVEAFDTILNSFTARVLAAKARIHYRDNAKLRIHRLPTEIFARILYFSLVLDHTFPYPKRLARLRYVARSWADIVQNTPIFWSYMDIRASPRAVQYMKEASKNTSLYVRFDVRRSSIDGVLPSIVDEGTLRRWETIYFCGNDDNFAKLVPHVEAGPLPLLSELFLYNSNSTKASDGHAQSFFALPDEGKNLRHIHLRGISMALDSPRLENIRSLQLSWLSSPPPAAQIARILLLSPHLDSLMLQHFYPSATTDSEDPGSKQNVIPVISLPYLTDLELAEIPSNYYSLLVPRINAPFCKRVQLGDNAKSSRESAVMDGSVWDRQTTQLGVTLLRSVLSATSVGITATEDSLMFTTVTEAGRINTNVVIKQAHPMKILPNIANLLSNMSISVPITIKTVFDAEAPFQIDSMTKLPTLTDLSVDGKKAYCAVLEHLAGRKEADDAPWPNSRIERLHFGYVASDPLVEDDWEELKDLVRRRWGDERQTYPRPRDEGFRGRGRGRGRGGYRVPPYRTLEGTVEAPATRRTSPTPALLIELTMEVDSKFSEAWQDALEDCQWMVSGAHPGQVQRMLRYGCTKTIMTGV